MKLRTCSPEDAGISSFQVRKIIERAQNWVADGIHPSLVILAARRGVIFLHEAIGRLGPEEDSPPIQLNTIFPVASLTKLLTAAVAMTLVEQGLLGLNRSVVEYIPEFQGEGKHHILVRHLMTHTTGMRDEDVLELALSDHVDKGKFTLTYLIRDDIDGYIKLVAQTQPDRSPDTVMTYANLNYQLLAAVITRITGMNLDELTRKLILSPLEMDDTHHILPAGLLDRVVRRSKTAPFYEHLKVLMNTPAGSSGVYSSAQDFAIFGQMLLNQGVYGDTRLLSPASVRAMTHNQTPGIGASLNDEQFPQAHWGLGWSVNAPFKGPLYGEPMLSRSAFGHGGAGGVFIWVDPVFEIVAVYFSVLRDEKYLATKGSADLFINMVMASIEEI